MEQAKKQWQVYWNKYKYFLLVLIIGMCLMLFSLPEHTEQQEETETTASEFDMDSFKEELCSILSAIDGVGRVEVMLSLESGEEAVYASDISQSNQNSGEDTSSENYQSTMSILSDGSYGEQPILIKSNFPTFRGAVVICDGADDSLVQLKITETVSSLCGISSDRISISKMSQ
jgi:stage III sporulation protein AG